jgi:ankyrin repeat protein
VDTCGADVDAVPGYLSSQSMHSDSLIGEAYALPSHIRPSTTSNCTSLILASANGHYDVAQFLLDRSANINAVEDGYTALYVACMNGHSRVVQLLLGRGALLSIRSGN